MSLPVFLRTSAELGAAIASRLLCPNVPDALRRAIAAEHIRTAVYMASTRADGTDSSQLIHTARLLANLRSTLADLWKDGPRDDPHPSKPDDWCRQVLDQLAELGDIQSVGAGYWLATPLRLVGLPDSDTLLVLGSAPVENVRSTLGASPSCAGVARFISRTSLAVGNAYTHLVQTFDNWLGITESLPTWTQNVIAKYVKHLSSPEDIGVDQIEVYAPDVMQKLRRSEPWIPAVQISQPFPSPRLCRPLLSHSREWARPHYMGVFGFRNGALSLRQTALLDFDIVHRLRFGFDQLIGLPRTVSIAVAKDTCVLDMRFRLSPPQNRIMSLGWSELGTSERWHLTTFHIAIQPVILSALRQLCVTQKILKQGH